MQELIQKLEAYARAICWQRLPDRQSDFDIITNEVVWKAIEKADEFREEAKFSTWFYAMVENECNYYLRKEQRRHKQDEVALEDDLPTKLLDIDARIDLVSILNKLTGDDHVLFRLVAEGQDFNTIGKELGISRNAALVRWNRLKGRLKDAGQ